VLFNIQTGSPVDDILGLVFSEPRSSGTGRPWVMLNIVSSIDGATAVDQGATALSDDDDRALFHVLRAVSDVILVGAGTVRAEDYRPVKSTEASREARRDRGMTPVARLAIVSGRLNLDPGARVFSDPDNRPLVLTGSTALPDRVEALSEVADVLTLETIDGVGIVGALSAKVVLCEGGPTLNGQLALAGVVDEVNWTVSPVLVSGDSKRMTTGEEVRPPTAMRLERALKGDRSLFLRYVRDV
jgi:riboflavin biosynthesis pyrimidine reductase